MGTVAERHGLLSSRLSSRSQYQCAFCCLGPAGRQLRPAQDDEEFQTGIKLKSAYSNVNSRAVLHWSKPVESFTYLTTSHDQV